MFLENGFAAIESEEERVRLARTAGKRFAVTRFRRGEVEARTLPLLAQRAEDGRGESPAASLESHELTTRIRDLVRSCIGDSAEIEVYKAWLALLEDNVVVGPQAIAVYLWGEGVGRSSGARQRVARALAKIVLRVRILHPELAELVRDE